MRLRRAIPAAVLATALLLGGCRNVAEIAPPQPPPVSAQDEVAGAGAPEIQAAAALWERAPAGTGTITYAESTDQLEAAQEQLLLDFMHFYYGALAGLAVGDPSEMFAPGARDQAEISRLLLEAMVEIRAMQNTDLTLTGYAFALDIQAVSELETGDLLVRVLEDFTQNFAAFPGVDSKGFGVLHFFTLTQTSEGWRLVAHRQADRLYGTVTGRRNTATGRADLSVDEVRSRREVWLAGARDAAQSRAAQGSLPDPLPHYDNPYDRTAAADYARRWATAARSPDWAVYDRLGGNCQNFVSQAIFAGGIPMDYTAPAQWKWFGDTPNPSFTASGRAPAWTGVNEFLSYAQNNAGFGMVALADAPFYSGELGDVIHLGVHGEWRHTVLITQTVADARGNTVDYLIASNTANLLDFPVSAYHYQEQMLIQILGWNG